jgi:hypothetical protein
MLRLPELEWLRIWSIDMNTEDKDRQRYKLIKEFHMLVYSLERIVRCKSTPTVMNYKKSFANFEAGKDKFIELVRSFVTFGDSQFKHDLRNIVCKIHEFDGEYEDRIEDAKEDNLDQFHDTFKKDFEDFESYIVDKICQVPIDWKPKLFEANTPFTTHLRILECLSSARISIDYIDRYLKSDFFPLYLGDLDKSIKIRLVTTKGKNTGGNKYGVEEVKFVSVLFSQEFKNYQLIQLDPEDFHDRNLRIDDKIFILGSGTDNAGKYPSNFGLSESTPEAHDILDELINKGKIIHGFH